MTTATDPPREDATTFGGRATDARLRTLLDRSGALVNAWVANEPGAWGKLAGAGVIAERRALGRPLLENERREVWRRLWALLEARREGDSRV